MNEPRMINPSDIHLFHFGMQDVLNSMEEKEMRRWKLRRAMILSNSEHTLINIYLKLPNGEMLETQTDLVNYADDFVTIKGGINIPTWIISDVDA
ncbi:MAG: hypothetical protein ABI663_07305 [Chryseolinea sp.]